MPEVTLNVVIKPGLSPIDRGDLFEDPITEALEKNGIGSFQGGGGYIDGSASDCSFVVNDLQRGLAAIRQVLRTNGEGFSFQIVQVGPPNVIHEVNE